MSTIAKFGFSLVVVFLIWVAGQLFGILLQESYVFANYVWQPFYLLREWNPNAVSNQELVKPVAIFRFIIMLLIWLLVLSAPVLLCFMFWYKRRTDDAEKLNKQLHNAQPLVLDVEKEIKDLVQMLDNPDATTTSVDIRLNAVFDSVVKFVTDFYGQDPNNVRVTLFAKDNDLPSPTGFRWGSQPSSVQKAMDLIMINTMIAFDTDHSFFAYVKHKEVFRDGDMNTSLLIRNIGAFRLGLLFAFKEEISIDEMHIKTQSLSNFILPFALLGLIDNIPNNVLRYSQGGGEANAI